MPLAVASRPTVAPAAPAQGRRLLAGAVAVVTALLLVGSAFAAYDVLGDRAPGPPAAPIGAPPELPTTSSSASVVEPADDQVDATREAPRTRSAPTTEAPRTREPVPTTTSVAPLPVPPPVPSPGPPTTSDRDPEPEPEPEPDPDPPVSPTGTQGGTRGVAAA